MKHSKEITTDESKQVLREAYRVGKRKAGLTAEGKVNNTAAHRMYHIL